MTRARRWTLAAEAFAALLVASLAVRWLPFRWIARFAAAHPRHLSDNDPAAAIAEVAWAVTAASRRARFRAVCIEQGLAAQVMLRRRGLAATLCYGAATDARRGIRAHVWVRCAERDVIGGGGSFVTLARFGGDVHAKGA